MRIGADRNVEIIVMHHALRIVAKGVRIGADRNRRDMEECMYDEWRRKGRENWSGSELMVQCGGLTPVAKGVRIGADRNTSLPS